MKKMFNNVVDLLPSMIDSFNNRSMYDQLEEGDIISFMPIEDEQTAQDFVAKTNILLANYFEVHDELCYAEDSYLDKEDNPIFFWKDYLSCFYTFKLVDEDPADKDLIGSRFGLFEIVDIAYIDEVNKRIKQRRLNGIRLEYKVKATPMDRNNHWNRSYDKDF
ncbi:hypothetical protein M8998_01345 [Sphingobacterium sp. lm-10]|uniref:hypothetical protein n=1 Tax=Sphingobacterium sp. lm-10 TaxID=2944904 RepID=UPI00202020AF|nr:hypothetical protein [Sphingobacterium sp. lm-10]MCL7986575.1 hypothetical protein [Sphingobacterium sp. lm-10]